MKRIICEHLQCTGCGACANICPVEAISMDKDSEGFSYPVIQEANCVDCDQCLGVCPVLNSDRVVMPEYGEEIYAGWSLDEKLRYNSTSGGLFSELALQILDRGGYVCGAVYDSQFLVHHTLTNSKADLDKLRQSKYMQSETGDCFLQIRDLLDEGKEVLFCGTPCQCGGLKSCLGERPGKLVAIDFICRGVNSGKVFRMYLDELEKVHGAPAERVWFKNKEYGWNCFSTRIDFRNGTFYLADRYHDPYMRGFIEKNLYMRPSCGRCSWKKDRTAADITLGDFWGVQMETQSRDLDKGISYVKINSVAGSRMLESIRPGLYLERKTAKEAKAGNMCIDSCAMHDHNRDSFFKNLEHMNIMDNINRFLD